MTSRNERAEMNNRTATHRIIAALCCMFALVLTTIGLGAPTATAADSTTDASAAAGANGSITVTYEYQDAALNLATINLYYLADWSSKGGYTPAGDFADHSKYPVDWNILNADQQTLRDFANTMAGYIEGNVLTCRTAALLIALPNVHKNADEQRTLSIEPKADCAVPPTTTISVNKVWKDKNSAKRPESVKMNLLQDGKIYDSIMLNNANDWKYTWKGLQAKHEYTVVEANVPGNYTALVDRENNDYTVTNTAKPEFAKTGASVAIIAVIVVVLAVAGIAIAVVVRKKNTTENAAAQTSLDDSE